MVAVLSKEEMKEFAQVLELQACQENGEWFIEEEGPIFDTMKVVEALCEGKRIYLKLR